MYSLYDYFLAYIGSRWAFVDNDIMVLIGPIGTVGFIIMAYFLVKTKNKRESDILTCTYTFLGCMLILNFLYGYIALPLSVVWVYYSKSMTKERVTYYYIRYMYGHRGGWHEASDLDECYDFEELCSKCEFDAKKMEMFYSSDKPIFIGYFLSVIVFLINCAAFKGDLFLPS